MANVVNVFEVVVAGVIRAVVEEVTVEEACVTLDTKLNRFINPELPPQYSVALPGQTTSQSLGSADFVDQLSRTLPQKHCWP